MNQSVVIKGNRYGISVFLDPQADFETLIQEVAAKFRESSRFFRGAKMALSFEGKKLSDEQQREVADTITANSQVEILCILDQDEEKERLYQAAIERRMQNEKANVGRFYKGTLRNGQVLESEGSVVILGDVNPGACAGITGNEKVFIAALEMEPTQLRIGNALGRGGDTKERRKKQQLKPMIAFVGD